MRMKKIFLIIFLLAMFAGPQPLVNGVQQFDPTLEILYSTYGDVLMSSTQVSCRILNDTWADISFEALIQSRGSDPMLSFTVHYQFPTGGDWSSTFEADNATVDIQSYVKTWEPTHAVNTTSTTIHESYRPSSIGISGNWESDTRDISVSYQLNFSEAVSKAQGNLKQIYNLPAEPNELVVEGKLRLSIMILGGLSNKAIPLFLICGKE